MDLVQKAYQSIQKALSDGWQLTSGFYAQHGLSCAVGAISLGIKEIGEDVEDMDDRRPEPRCRALCYVNGFPSDLLEAVEGGFEDWHCEDDLMAMTPAERAFADLGYWLRDNMYALNDGEKLVYNPNEE